MSYASKKRKATTLIALTLLKVMSIRIIVTSCFRSGDGSLRVVSQYLEYKS